MQSRLTFSFSESDRLRLTFSNQRLFAGDGWGSSSGDDGGSCALNPGDVWTEDPLKLSILRFFEGDGSGSASGDDAGGCALNCGDGWAELMRELVRELVREQPFND